MPLYFAASRPGFAYRAEKSENVFRRDSRRDFAGKTGLAACLCRGSRKYLRTPCVRGFRVVCVLEICLEHYWTARSFGNRAARGKSDNGVTGKTGSCARQAVRKRHFTAYVGIFSRHNPSTAHRNSPLSCRDGLLGAHCRGLQAPRPGRRSDMPAFVMRPCRRHGGDGVSITPSPAPISPCRRHGERRFAALPE